MTDLLTEDYFLGVDMWSVGCIFAELYSKRPVFMCKTEDEVLAKVFYMLGTLNPRIKEPHMI
jgi:hypothetical protein